MVASKTFPNVEAFVPFLTCPLVSLWELVMDEQFEELAKLLGNDRERVRLVLREFCQSVMIDLSRLEQAAAAHKWHAVREFAKRIQLGCLQIGELDAANAVATLGWIPGEMFADAYAKRRAAIVELVSRLKRVSGC